MRSLLTSLLLIMKEIVKFYVKKKKKKRNSEICMPSNKWEKFHKPKTPITVEKSKYNWSKKIVISIDTRLPIVKDKCDLFNVY